MEMFLMALCLSLFGVAASALAFGAATRGEPAPREREAGLKTAPALKAALSTPRFFGEDLAPVDMERRVPLEVLLLQIERHIRLEQAAAESFLHDPSPESLHSRTMSPLVH